MSVVAKAAMVRLFFQTLHIHHASHARGHIDTNNRDCLHVSVDLDRELVHGQLRPQRQARQRLAAVHRQRLQRGGRRDIVDHLSQQQQTERAFMFAVFERIAAAAGRSKDLTACAMITSSTSFSAGA